MRGIPKLASPASEGAMAKVCFSNERSLSLREDCDPHHDVRHRLLTE